MSRPPTREQIEVFREIGRRLDLRGFIAANDGNLSCRDTDGTLLVTATGARKGYLRDDEVVRIDVEGRLLHGSRPPSSETDMHRTAYRERPDVVAVVHAHPPFATAFAVTRRPLVECVLPEVVLTLGQVPLAPYGTPGTPELAQSIVDPIRNHDAVLLANHGAIAVGSSLEEAYFTLERVEHGARILFYAHLLGGASGLTAEEVTRLLATAPPAGPSTGEDAKREGTSPSSGGHAASPYGPSAYGASPASGSSRETSPSGLPCLPADSSGPGSIPSGDASDGRSPVAPDRIAEVVRAVLRERGLL